MGTNFPTSLDTLTNPNAGDFQDNPPHATQHANANDSIEAIEAKLGVDNSAVTTTLDYKVAHRLEAENGAKETIYTNNSTSGSVQINLANGNVQKFLLVGNTTFSFTGSAANKACSFSVIIVQDSTGGREVAWPATKWANGVIPSFTTGPNSVDIYTFLTIDNGTTWYGSKVGSDFK